MAKELFSRGWLILGTGRILWLSQDATGRPSAQGAESKDGGIIGKSGWRATVVQTLWTQTETCHYWLMSAWFCLKVTFDPIRKWLLIRTYYTDFLFQECSRLADTHFSLSQQICGFTDPRGSTSPSKLSPSHFLPCRKWEKMMLDLAVMQHFSPQPADCEWSLCTEKK